MTKITGKKRPREKNPADDTRRNRKKTRRDIADIRKQLVGLEDRIEQLERDKLTKSRRT